MWAARVVGSVATKRAALGVLVSLGSLGSLACGRANSGGSGANEARVADGATSATIPSESPIDGAANAQASSGALPRPTILPLPTAPVLPPAILSPILASTAPQPFPVSPACAGYVFADADATDTVAAHVQRGWAPRCKAILDEARKALSADYAAFASAKLESTEDSPSDKTHLAGAVMLWLPAGAMRGSAIYSTERTHGHKSLGPYCPYAPERNVTLPFAGKGASAVAKDETFAVSLKRLYRVGYGLLRLDGFPSDTVNRAALTLEAALDRCAAIARRGS